MQCPCGNELSALATSCPKCGKTFIFKSIFFVLLTIVVIAAAVLVIRRLMGE
jgi:hypothetical protein